MSESSQDDKNSTSISSSRIREPKISKDIINQLRTMDIFIGQQLNSGSFSVVCKAKYKGRNTAVKIINLDKTSNDYRNKFFPREIYVLNKLKHPNIIYIVKMFTLKNQCFIFMEFAQGGDIVDLLKGGILSEQKAKSIYYQIVDAMKYVHSLGIAHRDIKCENVLLDKNRTIAKLTDFGFATTTYDSNTGRRINSRTFCGSAAYVAPVNSITKYYIIAKPPKYHVKSFNLIIFLKEILKAEIHNPIISDCWSMGVVLFVLLNSKLPFSDDDLKKMLRCELRSEYHYTSKTDISNEAKALVRRHLEPVMKKRITMAQAFEDKWLQEGKPQNPTEST